MAEIGPIVRSSDEAPDSPGRLNGWSDVARHVGKSIRTAQRWEKDLGLPVHRITTPNGDLVYAFRTEVDAWARNRDTKATGEQTSEAGQQVPPQGAMRVAAPALSRPRRELLIGVGIGAAGCAILFALHLFGALPFIDKHPESGPTSRHVASSGAGPAGWDVVNGRLRIFDANSEQLWEYVFPFALDERAYVKDDSNSTPLVAMVDLENDGGKEVLFVAQGKDNADSGLFCFDANGAIRFLVRPRHRARFGGIEYPTPFDVERFFLTPEPNRYYTIWLVASDHDWFPSVLLKLTHTGDAIAEYWNDGQIDFVRDARFGSRRVLLVAGRNNEYRGPSLAVLDYDAPAGSAPADDPRYRCANCAPQFPIAAIVVPFASIWSEIEMVPHVDDVLLADNGYVTLTLHGRKIAEGKVSGRLNVLCTFDEHLAMLDAQVSDMPASSQRLAKAARAGLERDSRLRLFPVLRWLDGRRVGAPLSRDVFALPGAPTSVEPPK